MSFGAESMEDSDLARIGRPGSVSETVTAVARAKAAGFTNINLDVMYGLPGQRLESWQRTLAHCLALTPPTCPAMPSQSKMTQDLLRISSGEEVRSQTKAFRLKWTKWPNGYSAMPVMSSMKCRIMPSRDMPAGINCSIGPMANTLDAARAPSPI